MMGAFDGPQWNAQQEAEFIKRKAAENYAYDPNNTQNQQAADKYGSDTSRPMDNFLTTGSRGITGNDAFDARILNAMGPEAASGILGQLRSGGYDPASFEYGGSQAAGDAEAHRLNQMAGYMRTSRQAPVIDQSGMNASLAQALAARGQQAEAAGMFQNAAAGQGPTVAPAQMSLANALATSQGQQMLAAGPRGPAGAAAARAAALQGTGQMMGQNAFQAALARSGDQFGGMGGYQGTTNAMFGGDMRGAQTTANMAGAQADIRAQSQAQNDAMERYYAAQRAQVLAAQQQGRIAREGFQQGQVHSMAGMRAEADVQQSQRDLRNYENISSNVAAGTGAFAQYGSGKGK